MIFRILMLTALLTSLCSLSVAHGAIRPGAGSVTFNSGVYVFDGQEKLHAGPAASLRLGYDVNSVFGLEGSFEMVTAKSMLSSHQALSYLYRADALFYLFDAKKFAPYFVIGAGGMRTQNADVYTNKTSFVANYGLGAKYFVSDSFALRADVRHIGTFDHYEHQNAEALVGLSWYFGGESRTTAPAAPRPTEMVYVAPPAQLDAPAAPKTASVEPPAAQPVAQPVPNAQPVVEPPAAAPAPIAAAEKQAEPATPQVATIPVIRKIMVVGNTIAIHASAPIVDYKVMTLEDPPRIAIDIPGAVNGMKSNKIAVKRMGIKDVRVGTYPDKVRVVMDASGARMPAHTITKSATGLDFIITYNKK